MRESFIRINQTTTKHPMDERIDSTIISVKVLERLTATIHQSRRRINFSVLLNAINRLLRHPLAARSQLSVSL